MQYTIYWDLEFIINFIMDFGVLMVTAHMLRLSIRWWRVVLGACAGGASLLLLQGLSVFFGGIPEYLYYILGIAGVGIGMTAIAFPIHRIRELIVYFGCQMLVTITLGGMLQWLERLGKHQWKPVMTGGMALSAFTILYLLQEGMLRYQSDTKNMVCRCTLAFESGCQMGHGLLDSGNLLREPVSHLPVVVADAAWILPMLSADYQQLVSTYIEQNQIDYDWIVRKHLKKIRIIPYQTVGEKNGCMLGLKCQSMILQSDRGCRYICPVMIGISHTALQSRRNYQMILPASFLWKTG
jgi:stage II sporulation protein GA (sporulation sigma-E factor processing peptidase)